MSTNNKTIMLELAALKARVAVLEGREAPVAEASEAPETPVKKTRKTRDPNAPKKEANSWIKFTSRVGAVLKENSVSLGPTTAAKQFCSTLRTKNGDYAAWDDDAILAEASSWVQPDVSKQQAAGKNKTSRSSSTASKTSEAAAAATEEAAAAPEAPEEAVEEKPKKGRGRPKKTAAAPEVVAEPVLVTASSSEEAASEEEFETERFTLNGTDYYKSGDSDVFDSDTFEYLGILRGSKIVNCPPSDAVKAFLARSQ